MIIDGLPVPYLLDVDPDHFAVLSRRSGANLRASARTAYFAPDALRSLQALQRLAALGSDYNGWFNGTTIQVRLARYVVHGYQPLLAALEEREERRRQAEIRFAETQHQELVAYLGRARHWAQFGVGIDDGLRYYAVSDLMDRWHNTTPAGTTDRRTQQELEAALDAAGYQLSSLGARHRDEGPVARHRARSVA